MELAQVVRLHVHLANHAAKAERHAARLAVQTHVVHRGNHVLMEYVPHASHHVLLDKPAAEDHVAMLEEYAVVILVVLLVNSAKTEVVQHAVQYAIQTRHAVMEHVLGGNVAIAQMHVLLLK